MFDIQPPIKLTLPPPPIRTNFLMLLSILSFDILIHVLYATMHYKYAHCTYTNKCCKQVSNVNIESLYVKFLAWYGYIAQYHVYLFTAWLNVGGSHQAVFIYLFICFVYKPGETIQCAALFSHGTQVAMFSRKCRAGISISKPAWGGIPKEKKEKNHKDCNPIKECGKKTGACIVMF